MYESEFNFALLDRNASKRYPYADMVRAQEAVEKAEQDVQDAKQRVLRAKERMQRETGKTEYATCEVGYAQGQVWIAKAILADAKRRLMMAGEEYMKFVIDKEGRERLDCLYVDPNAIEFFARYHQPAVYHVETNCFKIPSAAQRKFIRNFEQHHDCTIYFVIEQLFPFPKESDDIHPTTSYLFFPNSNVRGSWGYQDEGSCLDECDCENGCDCQSGCMRQLKYHCQEALSLPSIYGNYYTYAYVRCDDAPHWSITGIAIEETECAGLQRCTYAKAQADLEIRNELREKYFK